MSWRPGYFENSLAKSLVQFLYFAMALQQSSFVEIILLKNLKSMFEVGFIWSFVRMYEVKLPEGTSYVGDKIKISAE